MGTLAGVLHSNAQISLSYAEGLLKDVRPADFARKPRSDGSVVDTNHPAFVYGHLSVYAPRMALIAGLGEGVVQLPTGFEELFAAGKECRDDPSGSIYPAMSTITNAFFDGHRRVLAKIAELDDASLGAPHGRPGDFAAKFPSRAAMLAFLLGGHIMSHLGQVSAWRRCLGLPSAF